MKYVLAVLLLFQYTLSVDVEQVVFNLTVLDRDGHAVSGLTAQNFRVSEDGREQTINLFQPEDTPATVGLVIDNSGSMQPKRVDVITAALSFVSASHPDDEMFVVNFNRNVWLGLPEDMPFTSSVPKLRESLLTTTAEGTTALYDGLELAVNHLKEGTKQRKALVLLSDGGDNASVTRLDTVLQMAQQSGATIYCIGIYDLYQKDKNPGVLRQIAKVTGGEAYFPKNRPDLYKIWPEIAGSIRGQYTIGYRSSNVARDGAYRKVKFIAVDKRGKPLDVRSRPGYFAPATN
jgi:Ca-activated chloride channel homolog